jgi:phosphocarrier protein
MKTKTVEVINKLGFHARAAAKFVHKANEFESQVHLSYKDQTVNGKSIMGLLMLAAPYGSNLDLIVDGVDEDKAIYELAKLILSGFNENINE